MSDPGRALSRRNLLRLALATAICASTGPAAAEGLARGRDGRILVPVRVNGRGPFRFVLDTGSAVSAVSRFLAGELRLPAAVAPSGPVVLQGSTGATSAERVVARQVGVDGFSRERWAMVVLPDASFADAEGVLGGDFLDRQRLDLRFGTSSFTLGTSAGSAAATTDEIRLEAVSTTRRFANLLGVRGAIGMRRGRGPGPVGVQAILDTGSQRTVGNTALRRALGLDAAGATREAAVVRGSSGLVIAADQIETPGLSLGSVHLPPQPLLYADLPVFDAWGWTSRPAILLGMDLLGRLDRLVIDYSRPRVWVAPAQGAGGGASVGRYGGLLKYIVLFR